MTRCGDLCSSVEEEKGTVSSPQHQLISLPRVETQSAISQRQTQPINPYEVLQIRTDATATEIKESYKRLALLHHPGRHAETSIPERLRRYDFFCLLSACYETLVNQESRRRYDSIRRQIEQSKLQSGVRGAMFVGGKPLMSNMGSYDRDFSSQMFQRGCSSDNLVPPLSRVSSSSSSGIDFDSMLENDDAQSSCCAFSTESSVNSPSRRTAGISRCVTGATVTTKASVGAPSLVDSASSEDEEDAELHYSESMTKRIFGGPAAHLFRARNFEQFSDPYVVFESAFGCQPFKQVSREQIMMHQGDEQIATAETFSPPKSPRSQTPKTTESLRSPDGGTTIQTTTRVLQDRRLIRTETITRLPCGKVKRHVAVTSEPLAPEANDVPATPPSNDCIICFANDSPIEEHDKAAFCEGACEFYDFVSQQLQCGHEELLEEWNRMLAFEVPFNFGACMGR